MTGAGVVGPLAGKQLEWLPSEVTTWKEWRAKHPETTVLEPPRPLAHYVGTNRAYEKYRRDERVFFPIGPREVDRRYANKDTVTIVVRDGKPRCYPHEALREGENADGGWKIVKKGATVRVLDAGGEEVPSMTAYWFAWCAFYPDGTLYIPPS